MKYKLKTLTIILVNIAIIILNIIFTIFVKVPFNLSITSLAPLYLLILLIFISYLYSRYPKDGEIDSHVTASGFINEDIKIAQYKIISGVINCLLSFQFYLIFFYTDVIKAVLSVIVFVLAFSFGSLICVFKLKSEINRLLDEQNAELIEQKKKEELGLKG